MMYARRIRRLRIRIPLLLLTFLSLSCGTGGSDFAGGGTGGTGISTGSISGFGSVVMNGVHYRTDNNTKKLLNGKKDDSGRMDSNIFAIGMIVSVRHWTGDNNALEIEYRRNLMGPVATKIPGADNVLEILGLNVVVDEPAKFDSLQPGDVVEVSGFADNAGRLRATYIVSVPPPMPPPFQAFDVKGFVSESSSTGFLLGPLPDGSGMTVAVSYDAAAMAGLSGGLDNGIFVQVTTADTAPVAGSITATWIERLASRTDFPENAAVDFEGLVTTFPSGSGKALSFAVEGKWIRTDVASDFTGHLPAEIQPNMRLLVRGTETGGVLSAARIIFR